MTVLSCLSLGMYDAHSCDVHIFISSHDSLKTAHTSSTLCSSCTHIRRSTFLGFWNALPGVAFFQLVAEPSVGFGQLDFILAGDDDVWSSGKTGHGGNKSLCSETCSRQCKEQDGRAMLWC